MAAWVMQVTVPTVPMAASGFVRAVTGAVPVVSAGMAMAVGVMALRGAVTVGAGRMMVIRMSGVMAVSCRRFPVPVVLREASIATGAMLMGAWPVMAAVPVTQVDAQMHRAVTNLQMTADAGMRLGAKMGCQAAGQGDRHKKRTQFHHQVLRIGSGRPSDNG